MKGYGYYYTLSDMKGLAMRSKLNQEIYDNDLSVWVANQNEKLYNKWVKKHPEAIKTYELLGRLHSRDQLIRGVSFHLFPFFESLDCDTNFFESFKEEYDSLLALTDFDNIVMIQSACIENNFEMINNFDNGYSTSKKVSLVISHNLKEGVNLEQTWERLFPYIEKAYLKGKISGDLFYAYDFSLQKHFGCQYYGTLGSDVPIKSPETFGERKSRLNL